MLSRSTFTASGIEPEATVQPAFLPDLPFVAAPAVAATMEAAALLFTVLSARDTSFGSARGTTALRYDFDPNPNADKDYPLVWVGPVDQKTLNQACPRNLEVQLITDESTKRLTALNPLLSKTKLGSLIHLDIGKIFIDRAYPDLRVEFSLDHRGKVAVYSMKGSVRLDLFELTADKMVCVYDYKTGEEGLTSTRALLLSKIAKLYYPQSKGIIMMQVKPKV